MNCEKYLTDVTFPKPVKKENQLNRFVRVNVTEEDRYAFPTSMTPDILKPEAPGFEGDKENGAKMNQGGGHLERENP